MDFGKIIIYTSNLRIIRAPPPRLQAPPPSSPPRPRERRGRRGGGARDDEERRSHHTETEVKGYCWVLVPPVFGCSAAAAAAAVMSHWDGCSSTLTPPPPPPPGVSSLCWFRLRPLLSVSWQQVVHVGQSLPPLRQPAALPGLLPPRPGGLHLLLLRPKPVGGAARCTCCCSGPSL